MNIPQEPFAAAPEGNLLPHGGVVHVLSIPVCHTGEARLNPIASTMQSTRCAYVRRNNINQPIHSGQLSDVLTPTDCPNKYQAPYDDTAQAS